MTADNLCVADGRPTAYGVAEPLRLAAGGAGRPLNARAAGRDTSHGPGPEQPLCPGAGCRRLRPDRILVLGRAPATEVAGIERALAGRALVAGTFAAGERRRYWQLAATARAGHRPRAGPPHRSPRSSIGSSPTGCPAPSLLRVAATAQRSPTCCGSADRRRPGPRRRYEPAVAGRDHRHARLTAGPPAASRCVARWPWTRPGTRSTMVAPAAPTWTGATATSAPACSPARRRAPADAPAADLLAAPPPRPGWRWPRVPDLVPRVCRPARTGPRWPRLSTRFLVAPRPVRRGAHPQREGGRNRPARRRPPARARA